MAKKSNEYWLQRFIQLQESLLKKGESYSHGLEKQYSLAILSLEKDIAKWYTRLATNNDISLANAKKLLNSKELKEFKWNVFEYIKYGEENELNGKWLKQLENASARVHISKLEALKIQLRNQVEVIFGDQEKNLHELGKSIYSEGYYHTAYEIQKGFNIGWDLFALDSDKVSKIISKPWAVDERNFSSRIWGNKEQLINSLFTQLTQAIIRGDAPDKAIKAIENEFNVSRHKAGRIVMTESAFFASASQKDCFKDLDVERYEIVATLDNRTSTICQSLDNKVFDMKDYEVGVTAPPFHPYCRTTTVPYFDDNYGERAARDADGKTYYVPSNISYKDWHNKAVVEPKLAQIKAKQVEVKSNIKNGVYNLKHNKENFYKHDPSHKRYYDYIERNKIKGKPKPSYLTVSYKEANSLVERYAGTGKIVISDKGKWNNKELIVADKNIGIHVNQTTGVETPTNAFFIHYGKTGTHIVPTIKGGDV